MTIYECDCGAQYTTIGDLREHLKDNPRHGTSATYGDSYRLIKMHLKM
jgi:hypothetical protein